VFVSDRRKVPWRKGFSAAATFVAVGLLTWLVDPTVYLGASRAPIVRQYGFIAFGVGLLVAVAIVGYLWWRDWQENQDFENRYGGRADKDT
jgi:hypothetical protein